MLVAHYYVHPDLQDLAQATGGTVSDSLEMARFAHEHPAKTIVVVTTSASTMPLATVAATEVIPCASQAKGQAGERKADRDDAGTDQPAAAWIEAGLSGTQRHSAGAWRRTSGGRC